MVRAEKNFAQVFLIKSFLNYFFILTKFGFKLFQHLNARKSFGILSTLAQAYWQNFDSCEYGGQTIFWQFCRNPISNLYALR